MYYVKYIGSALWRNSPARLAEPAASGGRSRTRNATALEASSLAMPARLLARTEESYP
jgi:hypothetical protein